MSFFSVIWMWLKHIVMLPANLAKVSSINKDLELQQKLSETQQRLKEAEDCLAKDAAIKAGRMFFDYNAYWARDVDGKLDTSPYCARCFDLNGKAVRLITRYRGVFRIAECPECKAKEIPLGEEPR
jgi:hypothetical protein